MDKLLDSVKDFYTIKKYLAAINQTTDDYLFVFDINNNKIQFFVPIDDFFNTDQIEDQSISFDSLLSIVHPADRKLLHRVIELIIIGKKDEHDINFRIFKQNGEITWMNSRGKVLLDDSGAPYAIMGRLSEEALRHLFNPITGLWNRTKLFDDLKKKLRSGTGWLMKLSIPSLAYINLSHGTAYGNKLLCEMADILEKIDGIEESYHIDRNNFAVIISDCNQEKVEKIYKQICEGMSEKCSVKSGVVPIDNSIFIDISQIIDSANITLREATNNKNAPLVFFSAQDITQRIRDLNLLEELKESVQNDFEGFEVYYQPQIRSGNYELYGVEALLRYNSKKRGRVFPDEFIPILEHSGLIDPVGMWVLTTALAQCKKWRKSIPALRIAVNFSPVQFDNQKLGEKIVEALKSAKLPGEALTIELTESLQLNENKSYYDLIKYVKSYGVRFAIDDFGTGYSNLGYLKQFDVNEIKIDRSFVSDIEKNTYNFRLISNVIEFAKINSIKACCEGVETTKELLVLEPLNADFFQGYLFDKPCNAEEIEQKYIKESSEKYALRLKVIEDIYRYKEQFGTIHFDPKNILHENNIGLWILRIDEKNNRYELYVDNVMESILGLTEKLSPKECYDYWHDRICADDVEYVDNSIAMMINDGKAVQLEYRWNHPSLDIVEVRSSGIRTQDDSKKIKLEGYHRILTGVKGV